MTSYYRAQLERITTDGEYAAQMQFIDGERINGNDLIKTNWMNLNSESAKDLIEWLQKRFLKEAPK